jgi:flagellin
MPLTVNTNMASTNAVNKLSHNTMRLEKVFERVSSGLRINNAGDDAAGLGMAENLDAAYRGLRQAMRNANDGMSVIEVAEGASNEVANIVKRMRELAVQGASETLGTTERAYLADEFNELSAEVDRIASVTEFNGVILGNGSLTQLDVQVGINNTLNDRIQINLGDLRATTLGIDTGAVSFATATAAQTALANFDIALDTVNSYRSVLGAGQNRLESSIRNLSVTTENIKGAESRIRDADFAYETAEMSKLQILNQAGVAVLGQANQLNQGAVRLIGG